MDSVELELELTRVKDFFNSPKGVFRMLSPNVPDYDKALYWYASEISPRKSIITSLVSKAFARYFKLHLKHAEFGSLSELTRNKIIIEMFEPLFLKHNLICTYIDTYPFSSSLPALKTNDTYHPSNTHGLMMFDLANTKKVEFENYIYIRIPRNSHQLLYKIGTAEFDKKYSHMLLRELAVDTTHSNTNDPRYQIFKPQRFKAIYDLTGIEFNYFLNTTLDYHLNTRAIEPYVVQQLLTPCLKIFMPIERIDAAFAIYGLTGTIHSLVDGLSTTTSTVINAEPLPDFNLDMSA